MKRKHRLLFPALLSCLCAVLLISAYGAGDEQDPVLTKSYLETVATAQMQKEATAALNTAMNQPYSVSFRTLAEAVGNYNLEQLQTDTAFHRANAAVLSLKRGDKLTLQPGTQAMPISGIAVANCSGIINVTSGYAVKDTGTLYYQNLYMKNDAPTGGITVTSDTAEIWIKGVYSLQAASGPNYLSLADALNTMGLFQGTGHGYLLEKAPTRAQGLVMFLRMMGLEDEALAYTGSHPFTDVPRSHWAYRYVAYAYHAGLTNGSSAYQSVFSPDSTITAQHYLTLLMRALHYQEGSQFQYSTVATDAVRQGLFQSAEIRAITNGSFLRGRLVYLSYQSLFCIDQSSGRMLLQQLITDGTISLANADRGICQVIGGRLT